MLRPYNDFFDLELPSGRNRPLWNIFDQDLSVGRLPSFSADLVDCGSKYCVHADLPGMPKDNINISLQGRDLRIEGERKERKFENNERFRTQERYYGKFIRTIRLPEDATIDPNQLSASYKDGVLNLDIPKMEESTKKQYSQRTVNSRTLAPTDRRHMTLQQK